MRCQAGWFFTIENAPLSMEGQGAIFSADTALVLCFCVSFWGSDIHDQASPGFGIQSSEKYPAKGEFGYIFASMDV